MNIRTLIGMVCVLAGCSITTGIPRSEVAAGKCSVIGSAATKGRVGKQDLISFDLRCKTKLVQGEAWCTDSPRGVLSCPSGWVVDFNTDNREAHFTEMDHSADYGSKVQTRMSQAEFEKMLDGKMPQFKADPPMRTAN